MVSPLSEASFQLPNISGYTVAEQLYSGEKTVVYRAIAKKDRQRVVIKVLKDNSPSTRDLAKLRNQFAIAQNLHISGIVKPLSLESWRSGYMLIMEDFGGISLADYAKSRSLDLIEILAIGVQVAGILQDLAQHGLIHKDIKPANLIIHPESHQVKLTDFSISSRLPKENQQPQAASELVQALEGTLSYIAPEQTGRMNRGIDYRADFYALGVTLYEMLTGKLPFVSDDPLTLVHAHIAKLPVSPHDAIASIPRTVSAIVLKLMAKNAEDRYQSARGLKFDLERCLYDLKETGTVTDFALAQRDICDRFLIPEKLYGREAEVTILLDAFARVATPSKAIEKAVPFSELSSVIDAQESSTNSTEIVLVAGSSGIGKTAIINEVHKPITQQRGYFIQGKFDQFNRNTPFSAIANAFRGLIAQLSSETDAVLSLWKTSILEAVGESAQVIIDVIPELETILGPQLAVPELSGAATQARFNQLFSRFVRAIARQDRPLVLFLDDLQWADAASLSLLEVLAGKAKIEYFLVLGAYRDNEIFTAHPLMLTTDKLKDQGTRIHTLALAPLSEKEIARLVADTLHCSSLVARPLADLVYKRTKGNPFFATQFLKGLQEESCIVLNADLGQWQCNLGQAKQLAATDDVVSFTISRLQKLPAETRSVLQLAACLGSQFDLHTLSIVCKADPDRLSADLWAALQEEFIILEGEAYQFLQDEQRTEMSSPLTGTELDLVSNEAIAPSYRFLHDRIQQAAYISIPEAQRASTHYQIGRCLQRQFSLQGLELRHQESLFEVVNHLNFGQHLLSSEAEKVELAQLNLLAGRRALDSTAYEAAIDYLNVCIALLEMDGSKDTLEHIWSEHYDLAFDIHYALCFTQLNTADYKPLTKTIKTALQYVNKSVDLAEIYVIQAVQLTLESNYQTAVEAGLRGLEELGIYAPLANLSDAIQSEFIAIAQALENTSIQSLLDLPIATDAKIKAAIKLLIAIDPPAYISGNIELYSFVSLKAVSLSVANGNIPESAKAYANYGLLLGLTKGDYHKGYEFADLAVKLSYQLGDKSQRCKTALLLGGWIHAWARPIAGAAEINYQGFLAGLEAGEHQFAAYNLFASIYNQIFQGENLAAIAADVEKYDSIANKIKDELLLTALAGAKIFDRELRDEAAWSDERFTNDPDIDQAKQIIQKGEAAQSWFGVCLHYILKMHLACLKADFDSGMQYEIAAGNALNGVIGFTTCSDYYYYGSIILLNYHSGSPDKLSQTARTEALERVQDNQKQLKTWSKSCPENFLHKFLLVEAERCRVSGKKLAAIALYDRAIVSAKENGFVQTEALANELAAKFYLQWDKEKFAEGYIQAACNGYARWGATAKVAQLKRQYPHLLADPVYTEVSTNSTNPMALGAVASHKAAHRSASVSNTREQANLWLDLPAVMQAAQTISQEIALEKLLETLMQIAMANAGAQSGHLLLRNNGDKALEDQWMVAVRTIQDKTETLDSPLLRYSDIPRSLLYSVIHTGETAVFEDLRTNEQFASDPYTIAYKPKSVLCMPISRQGTLVGILYLENRLAAGAFTRDRIELLQLLASQAAISIENARLYQQVEQYSQTLEAEVARKTAALNQKAQDLEAAIATIQKTQAQLIQTEKMSSLGQMVAGIAHEINNPISFIRGNITYTRNYVEDILHLLLLYQQEYPLPSVAIQAEQEELDIDFLVKDISLLLDSMESGSNRIQNIVLSLRNFSRLDESAMKQVDLHSGLESTLLIVQSRLQAGESGAAIQVVKSYGKLPEVTCYPSQLNQVFLHIINNAIDALREQTPSGQSPRIEIKTEVTDRDRVRIAIANNGRPIPADIQNQIFDPFFTTKEVGSGTGLGLFVSYSTIQKHNGQLSVRSTTEEKIEERSTAFPNTEFEILLPIK